MSDMLGMAVCRKPLLFSLRNYTSYRQVVFSPR
jgi:hypothetical protein